MAARSSKAVFGFESPDDSPGFLLWQVTNLWQRRIRAALEPLGLTHVQFVFVAGAITCSRCIIQMPGPSVRLPKAWALGRVGNY